jgi:aryl carrier-like protein
MISVGLDCVPMISLLTWQRRQVVALIGQPGLDRNVIRNAAQAWNVGIEFARCESA